eukprot:4483330-Pyramimonas_sp.AAC.1
MHYADKGPPRLTIRRDWRNAAKRSETRRNGRKRGETVGNAHALLRRARSARSAVGDSRTPRARGSLRFTFLSAIASKQPAKNRRANRTLRWRRGLH